MQNNTDKYITLLSRASNHYGCPHLINLMNECQAINLRSITEEQAEQYYLTHITELAPHKV